MDDDDEFDFDKYAEGDYVEWTNDEGVSWQEGTVVGIDHGDESLPWAVSNEALDDSLTSDAIREFYDNESNWHWCSDPQVRPGHYLDKDFVIQEDTLAEMSW